MVDLARDLNKLSPNYGDLLMVDGSLVLTSDADTRGTNNVLQDILCRLRTFQGEWFLDNELGMPWFQLVLGKNPDLWLINSRIKATILETPGVFSLDRYTSTLERSTRRLPITFACTTVAGRVAYNGALEGITGDVNA
jgi:hypothetical protein